MALSWSDIDLELMQVNVRRSCVRNRFEDTKTEASRKPVPLHPSVAKVLYAWRDETPYSADDDFVFASWRLHGKEACDAKHGAQKDDSPGTGEGRHHRQGHRLAQLPPLPRDQPPLPASTSRRLRNSFVMPIRASRWIYTKAISLTKREANDRVMQMVLGRG